MQKVTLLNKQLIIDLLFCRLSQKVCMNTVLNYLAISALTTAAATAVAMGEPATLELAIARVGLMLGNQKDDSANSHFNFSAVDSSRSAGLHYGNSAMSRKPY
jgi:hypothetical protein